MKQPDPEILLQSVDLMADCGRGDMQLVGGLAEAHIPGRRFKSPKCAQRRQMAIHIR
jgi:hypothetical protein